MELRSRQNIWAILITKHMFRFTIQERIIYIINLEFLKFGIQNFLFKIQL